MVPSSKPCTVSMGTLADQLPLPCTVVLRVAKVVLALAKVICTVRPTAVLTDVSKMEVALALPVRMSALPCSVAFRKPSAETSFNTITGGAVCTASSWVPESMRSTSPLARTPTCTS